MVSEIKWQNPSALIAPIHLGQDPKEMSFSLRGKSTRRWETPFESLFKKKLNCPKTSRERAKVKIQPTDGARACWQIGLDGRQLGLLSEMGANCRPWEVLKKSQYILETKNRLNNSLVILSYKKVNIPFVPRFLAQPYKPTSSSNSGLLFPVHSLKKLEANKEVATVAVG